MGTTEKLTVENMGIGILSLSGSEPEIHLGVIYPSPRRTFYVALKPSRIVMPNAKGFCDFS